MSALMPTIAFGLIITIFVCTTIDWRDKQDMMVGGGVWGFLMFVVVCGTMMP
jgi:hypothetical protein